MATFRAPKLDEGRLGARLCATDDDSGYLLCEEREGGVGVDYGEWGEKSSSSEVQECSSETNLDKLVNVLSR